jgi:hypothetical protein
MWFLVEFKISEILRVTISNTICAFSFDTKCVHCTMETTQNMVIDSSALHFNTTDGGFLGNCNNYTR